MRFSGFFQATTLSPDWRGYHQLAAMMERRRLTNYQAQVILWYTRGLGPSEIGKMMGDKDRSNVGKALRVGVRRLVGPHPELRQIRHTWAKALLLCFKNRRGGCYNPPVVFDRAGNLVSLRPKILIPDDFDGWRETTAPTTLNEEIVIPPGWEEKHVHDLDLFAELLAALQQQREPAEVLERLLPDELADDPLVFSLSA